MNDVNLVSQTGCLTQLLRTRGGGLAVKARRFSPGWRVRCVHIGRLYFRTRWKYFTGVLVVAIDNPLLELNSCLNRFSLFENSSGISPRITSTRTPPFSRTRCFVVSVRIFFLFFIVFRHVYTGVPVYVNEKVNEERDNVSCFLV